MFRLASTKVTTPVNESAQVLLAERSRSSRISATVVKAELPALHGQTMADRMRIIVRKRTIIIIVVPTHPRKVILRLYRITLGGEERTAHLLSRFSKLNRDPCHFLSPQSRTSRSL